jgi:uncharacterized protein YdaU (DUF1376 family)
MHFYPHHIGDFLKDTSHLNDHQLATYLRMMWKYYLDESPITGDFEDIAFAMRTDEKTVRTLLKHFFIESESGWAHARCDKVIAEFHSKSESARLSAKARWDAKNIRTQCERNANASKKDANEPIIDATQNPEPRTQNIEPKGSSSTSLPPCPQKKLLELFSRHCPTLPQPRPELWINGKNGQTMSARWKWVLTAIKNDGKRYAETPDEAVEWFDRYFGYIASRDFLMGKTTDWQADLGWLMKAENFEKVLNKNYKNKDEK